MVFLVGSETLQSLPTSPCGHLTMVALPVRWFTSLPLISLSDSTSLAEHVHAPLGGHGHFLNLQVEFARCWLGRLGGGGIFLSSVDSVCACPNPLNLVLTINL